MDMHADLDNIKDAVLAAQAGVDGILLSNHGGEC
jgi:isopentenyl diphosphate isomerase/L-lactate dehydrogenase-like FMN-dependent dehydrogenase